MANNHYPVPPASNSFLPTSNSQPNNPYAQNVSPHFLQQVQRAQQDAALRHLSPHQLAIYHQQQQQQQPSQMPPPPSPSTATNPTNGPGPPSAVKEQEYVSHSCFRLCLTFVNHSRSSSLSLSISLLLWSRSRLAHQSHLLI